MKKAGDVFDNARVYLNDVSGSYFTDDILLPYLKIALDDLRGELLDNNIPITNAVSAVLTITTAMSDVGGSTGPALPTGLVEIQDIHERTSGSSEDYVMMTRVEFLPLFNSLFQQLIVWTWQQEVIKFNGALSNREIKINYLKDAIVEVQNKDTIITMIRSIPFLSYRTGALAAEFGGEDKERAGSLNSNAGRELDKLMNLSIKGRQSITTRRRPFMAGYKRGGYSIS